MLLYVVYICQGLFALLPTIGSVGRQPAELSEGLALEAVESRRLKVEGSEGAGTTQMFAGTLPFLRERTVTVAIGGAEAGVLAPTV